jgi:hypothetical protein
VRAPAAARTPSQLRLVKPMPRPVARTAVAAGAGADWETF